MRKPTSTYRLQITEDFDLFEASRRLAYLQELGVDWVYLSPLLAAEPGSSHGYDVVAHDRIDPARGGAEGLADLSAEARRLGLGVLVDIVPNHVGVATPAESGWWWDLLQHGRGSAHADAFDVDWVAGDGRVLVPVLGDDDEGSIHVADGELRYHEMRFPLAPGTSSHDEQHYRLVNWRLADTDLNYRRFFAVNTLAAIRVEDPRVFDDSHVEIRRWFDERLVDGLRVDHPDGLRDPQHYLDDLSDLTRDSYVLVEKILEPGEELPTEWATAGTTGYDALAHIDRVLTDPAGQDPLDALEARLSGGSVDWHDLIHDTKRAVADGILNSEVNRITREVVSTGAVAAPDSPAVADAVAELIACFPVYRSYLPGGREHLDQAFAAAREHRPDLAATFDLLLPVLSDPDAPPAIRFQQTSGMVMAKGVEDCAFYRYNRLTSLNEVGGDPSIFSLDVDGFHAHMRERQESWPDAMVTLSTHDTKRGEDVRARITALAEIPHVWETHLSELLTLVPLPDPSFGALLWQAILGAWPAQPQADLRVRLHGYAEKAMREAGDRTQWTSPDEAYERAVHAAVDAALDDPRVGAVVVGLLEHVKAPGESNSLAAKLLSITIPGVPDIYQGSELWEQSLVDPDNRRFVDFDERQACLDAMRDGEPTSGDGEKQRIVHAALTARRDRPDLFTTYTPLAASGSHSAHVLAFDRGGAVSVVTRLPIGLAEGGGWGDTTLTLPEGLWRTTVAPHRGEDFDRFSGGVRLADLLADLPVALLVKES